MSVEIESVSRESHRDSRHVRLQDTPEYIPMLNQGMLAVMGCNTPPVGAQRPRKSTNEGDYNKDQSENDIGRRKTMIGDGASDTTTTELDNEFKGIGIMTAAKLILKSKKAAKKAKSKCRQNAAKRLIKQLTQDSEMFQRYNLADVHNKMKRQKQLRLAFIQKRFLDELPILAEKSVKDHLDKRIEVLENLKKQQLQQPLNNGRSTKLQLEKMEEYERPNSRILTRRQSQLRKSFDLSTLPLNLFCDIGNPDLTPTKEDLQNLLAMAKSREKIESDLDLPMDRMQRLSTLRKNVNRINEKFKSLKETKNGLKKDTDEEATEEKFYAPSRFIKIGLVCIGK